MTFVLPYRDYEGYYEPDSFEDKTTKNLRAVERILNAQTTRIVHGLVDDDGSVVTGDGFSVSKTGTGTYTVTFSIGFASAPTVVVGSPSVVLVSPLATPTSLSMSITASGVATDASFYFAAIL